MKNSQHPSPPPPMPPSSASSSYSSMMIKSILSQVDQQIPVDSTELKQKWIYKGALQQLQWQRDCYMSGPMYANKRKTERVERAHVDQIRKQKQQEELQQKQEKEQQLKKEQEKKTGQHLMLLQTFKSAREYVSKNKRDSFLESVPIPQYYFDPMAPGPTQLIDVATKFIPSSTVQNALVPLLVPLPNMLYESTIRTPVVEMIKDQQHNLNTSIKNQSLQFLRNPNNRTAIKNWIMNQTIEHQVYPGLFMFRTPIKTSNVAGSAVPKSPNEEGESSSTKDSNSGEDKVENTTTPSSRHGGGEVEDDYTDFYDDVYR